MVHGLLREAFKQPCRREHRVGTECTVKEPAAVIKKIKKGQALKSVSTHTELD